ncbi:MAG: rhodanese-related sulfurtransferase [Armatimonadetes bacterium]|nr:MAG: rhodanese-related sulfurtransferase [Armatimonadota bacterium]
MFRIAAFYRFVELDTFADLRDPLHRVCRENDVVGTVLLAPEGINGTIAGSEDGVVAVLDHIRSVDPRLAEIDVKFSESLEAPFVRLKIRLKKEIVSLGVGAVDTVRSTGQRVPPEDWNSLISDPNIVLIDARNDYEVAVGTFDGAINPATRSFTQFPQWIASRPELADKPRIAMFCTGGIRCEKASAYLKDQGFEDVYQLDGGILRYLETVPEEDSSWNGECYVFDRRVSVGHGLVPGDKEICVNCNRVLGDDDRSRNGYIEGVSCPACADSITESRRARFAERQHQIELARKRGTSHLGSTTHH